MMPSQTVKKKPVERVSLSLAGDRPVNGERGCQTIGPSIGDAAKSKGKKVSLLSETTGNGSLKDTNREDTRQAGDGQSEQC